MRFEVPQFIQIEDKIFGPFTWKQFIYLIGGGGIAGVLFITTPFIIFLIFGLPVGGLAVLLAFYPVNNRPFSIYLESMLRFASGTKLYLWRKQNTMVYGNDTERNVTDQSSAVLAQNMHVPTVTKSRLNNLAHELELTAIERS